MRLTRCIDSDLFRRIELQQLMNLTARALGQPPLRVWTLPHDRALHAYATFTRDHLQAGVDDALLQRMNREAHRMGRLLRHVFGPRGQADVGRLAAALYRNIGISLEGQLPGRLCFTRCFFARYYTPAICLAASALDRGILSGLAGDGQLRFQQRITDGCEQCIATFT